MANARPAIVIGIGGTGSWVLSWLKKDLLETYGSLDDQPIRLLLIDTADVIAQVGAIANARGGQQGGTSQPTGYSRYVILDNEREFVQVPTDPDDSVTRRLKAAVLNSDPAVSHIGRWWQADFYPDAVLRLKDGAGQFRQLGRLALMQGLHSNGANDKLYGTLTNMIDAVTRIAARSGMGDSLDVHIAGSLLGGTGSGLFIDIAWLVRKVLEERGDRVQPFITGFFALPGAFSAQPRLDSRMKAFAAWRELNRMMTVRERESEFIVRWGTQAQTTFTVRKEVYDHVYLVDRGLGTPGTRPEESVFPVIAEAISFYLDSSAGTDYIQHIRTNLVNPKQTAPRRGNPTYSVLYVKSWKLPTYHNLRVARHAFAREFLRRLLQVVEEQGTNYTSPDQERSTFSLRSDPLYRMRASEVFIQPMQDTGGSAFLEDVAGIAQIGAGGWLEAVTQRAGYGFNLLDTYGQLPKTPEAQKVQDTLNTAIYYTVPGMMDSNSNAELSNFLDTVYRQFYGVNSGGGDYLRLYGDFGGEAYKGELHKVLEGAQTFHVDVFKRRVRAWLRTVLNEPTHEGFSGLACARDAMIQLVENLKEAVRFYVEVKGTLASVNEVQNNASLQYQIAAAETAKRGPIATAANMAGTGGKRNVRLYLEYELANLSIRRDHRTVERVISTLRLMQQHIETQVMPRIEALVQQLVTDNDFTRVTGLYRGLLDSLVDEYERHQFDIRLKEITEILQAADDDAPAAPIDEARLDELLARTRWSLDDNLTLRVEIQVSADSNDPPITLESNVRDGKKTIELVNRLVDGVAAYVVFADDNQSALSVMGVERLGAALPSLVGRFLHASNPNRVGNVSDIRTFYVRAAATQQEEGQINQALNNLNIPRGSTNTVKMVQSNNRNKVTVFSARELLLPESFAEWEAAHKDYRAMMIGVPSHNIDSDFERVRNDHLFAAEREALRLEHQYFNDDKVSDELPILDQRLVHLLEEHQRFDRFLEMWACGWIVAEKESPSDPDMLWRIRVPETDDYAVPMQTLARREDTDILGLIARFAIYGKTMQGRDLPYSQIENAISANMRQVRVNRDQAEALLAAYTFETQAAVAMHRVISQQLQSTPGEIDPEAFQAKYDRAVKALDRPDSYAGRRALAEEIAYDFTRFSSLGNSRLVTNIEAHQQAVGILLRLKFTNLARLLRPFMQNG